MKRFLMFAVAFAVTAVFATGMHAAGGRKDNTKDAGRNGNPSPATVFSSTIVFQEGFNDTTFPPPGWTIVNVDGDAANDGWYQSSSVGGSGGPGPYEGSAFAADWYGSANGFFIDDWFITPDVGGTTSNTVDSLTFWVCSRLSSSGNYPDSIMVLVSTTDTSLASFTMIEYFLVPKAVWTRRAYALPNGAHHYIAFRYLIYDGGPTGTNSDKVCLDDVQINSYPSTSVDDGAPLPSAYSLHQNYPNPFNPSTQISFDLKRTGYTTLKVYDALGREVATLVDEEMPAGSHFKTFNAVNRSSGVYLYRLTSGTYTETLRLLLLK